MATKRQSKASLRPQRRFSEAIRKQVVRDIEVGKASVLEASRELSVAQSTVYKWVYRYSRYLEKNQVMVVEDKSESYRTKELEKRLKEAEAALGRKQMEVEFLNKMMEIIEEKYIPGIKKKLHELHLDGIKLPKDKPTASK
jgi:transposase-like protein